MSDAQFVEGDAADNVRIAWLDESEWIIEARQERSRRTVRKILDAAIKLFVANGYEATTMAQIAEKAGIAAGSIYRRFADKDALLNAVVDSYQRTRVTEFDRYVAAHIERLDDSDAILELYNRIIFSAYRKDVGFIRLVERRSLVDAELRRKQHETYMHVANSIAAVLAAARPDLPAEHWRKRMAKWHLMQRGILVSLVLPDGDVAESPLSLDDPEFEAEMLQLLKTWIG